MDTWVLVGLVVTALAALAAVVIVIPTYRAAAPARVARNLDKFRERYQFLRDNQIVLGQRAQQARLGDVHYPDIPLFTQPGWILQAPIEIDGVNIDLRSDVSHVSANPRKLKGLSLAGALRYSEALQKLNPDSPYFNGTIYSPVSIDASDGSLAMAFETGKYFDYIDTSEVLAFAASLRKGAKLRAQREQTDTFALEERVASLGVLTLTVLTDGAQNEMLLHKRSGKFVVGDALYHVVPAGEFAPSDIGLAAIEEDFDLWRNIMREYAEEYLGMPDAQGQGGRRIDYANASPFKDLSAARSDGRLHVFVLGVGLDPLTLKPELLTVAVFERACFDEIFPRPFSVTDEGIILEGIPFNEKAVHDYVKHSGVRSGAKACLKLTWAHRRELGLTK
jgi:hypothetical protein